MFLEMNDNEQDKLFYPKAMKLQSNDQFNLIVTLYANTERRLDTTYLMHSLGLTQKPQLNSLITQLRRHGFDIHYNSEGYKLVDIVYKEKPKPKTQCFKPQINPLLSQVFR